MPFRFTLIFWWYIRMYFNRGTVSIQIMRHKTITLCPTTYELSKKMPNFSQWVRDQVLKHGRTNNMHKESRVMFHRECGSDVTADWKQFMDGSYAWFGYCEQCHTDVVWRPRTWTVTFAVLNTTMFLQDTRMILSFTIFLSAATHTMQLKICG